MSAALLTWNRRRNGRPMRSDGSLWPRACPGRRLGPTAAAARPRRRPGSAGGPGTATRRSGTSPRNRPPSARLPQQQQQVRRQQAINRRPASRRSSHRVRRRRSSPDPAAAPAITGPASAMAARPACTRNDKARCRLGQCSRSVCRPDSTPAAEISAGSEAEASQTARVRRQRDDRRPWLDAIDVPRRRSLRWGIERCGDA